MTREADRTLDKIYEILAENMNSVRQGSGKMLLQIYNECKAGREYPAYERAIAGLIARKGVHYIMGGAGILRLRFSDMKIVDGFHAFNNIPELNQKLQSILPIEFPLAVNQPKKIGRLHSLIKAFIK